MQHCLMQSNHNRQQYSARIRRVLDFISSHLNEKLSLSQLSDLANFSPFHFHRQFTAYTGVPLNRMILLMRLKQAAQALGTNSRTRVLDIAQQAGFESPESFSRAFKRFYDLSPSQYKKTPDWERFNENKKLLLSISQLGQPGELLDMNVEIVTFPNTPIAVLEHRGPERLVYETSRKFIRWRQRIGINPQMGDTYGLHYTSDGSSDDYRFNISVSFAGPIEPNPEGIVSKLIPEGRCAKIRHVGSRDHIPVADFLYREWLPASGEELRDFPFFFHYLNVGTEVQDSDMVTDLYLPLR